MAKRGPKPYQPTSGRLMPVRLIAQRLNVSVRTVNYDLRSGLAKLQNLAAFYAEVR